MAIAYLVVGIMHRPALAEEQDNSGIVISTVAAPDYVRPTLADGTFKQETYVFGEGGLWAGSTRDDSSDTIKFIDVAHALAPRLAKKNYLPTNDPNVTKLLIMVYWGTTTGGRKDPVSGSGGRVADGYILDRINTRNAGLLGFDRALASAGRFHRQDLLDVIEDDRYFVVLIAYDFQLLWRKKTRQLLWEARFSVPERGYAFNLALPAMIGDASRYFGRSTDGLIQEKLNEGQVTFGELKILGTVP